MPANKSAGVYLLAAEHAEAVQRFAADATFASMVGIADPSLPTAGVDMVARSDEERLAGGAYWYAIVDAKAVKGVAALQAPYSANACVLVWIDPVCRRQGYGALAVRMVLEFAFRNLQLQHVIVPTMVPNAPASLVLTRAEWIAQRDRPAVAALRADLRAILDAELLAGNEIVESGGGWPDPDSIFIRLRDPFRTTPSPLPPDLVYTEPNDPHWWKADFSSRTPPRHILAC